MEEKLEAWVLRDGEYKPYEHTVAIAPVDFKLEEGEEVHIAMSTDPINEESPIYKTHYVVREDKIIIISID
jgi:hypothetical protein